MRLVLTDPHDKNLWGRQHLEILEIHISRFDVTNMTPLQILTIPKTWILHLVTGFTWKGFLSSSMSSWPLTTAITINIVHNWLITRFHEHLYKPALSSTLPWSRKVSVGFFGVNRAVSHRVLEEFLQHGAAIGVRGQAHDTVGLLGHKKPGLFGVAPHFHLRKAKQQVRWSGDRFSWPKILDHNEKQFCF